MAMTRSLIQWPMDMETSATFSDSFDACAWDAGSAACPAGSRCIAPSASSGGDVGSGVAPWVGLASPPGWLIGAAGDPPEGVSVAGSCPASYSAAEIDTLSSCQR